MSTRIRLRYSTIVNYASMLYRMAAAVGFVVIVARRLSLEEFGLWGIIFSVSGMLASLVTLWSMWVQRFYARGWSEAPGTGFLLTLIYWIPGSLAYLAIAFLQERVIGWGLDYMSLGLPIFMFYTVNQYFISLANVSKPELRGYRGFLYDTLRLLLAYILVIRLDMGLTGAILAIESALLAGSIYMGVELYRAQVLRPAFSRDMALGWLRAFYIPLSGTIYQFMRAGIRAFVSWVSGSEAPVAYLNVGFASEAPLLQASQAATPALYARILRKKRGMDIEESLRLFLLFAGYMLATFTVLSRTIASLYNPQYAEAHLVIPLIAIYATLLSLAGIYGVVLRGAEEIDKDGIPSYRKLLRSQLFRVPVSMLGTMVLSYALAIPLLVRFRGDPLKSAEAVALVLAISTVPLLVYFYREAVARVPHRFPSRDMLAVFAASLATALYYLIAGVDEMRVTKFWEYAPLLVLHLAIAAALYCFTTYLLSPWFRKLVRDALFYIRNIKNKTTKGESR